MSDINITVNDEIVNIDVIDTPVVVEVTNSPGPAGAGVAAGGTTGQVLAKASNTNYDTVWVNPSTGGVPYSGATGNVNLGEYELKAGQVTLDTSPTGTAAVGTIRWNDTTGTSETTLKGGNVILKNGVDLVARVVNKVTPNTTLTKAAYQAVRVSGAQGQRLAVAFAQANNDNNSADTIGLVIETIATNQEGFIMTVGQIEGINTTGSLQGETWNDGDIIYLSPTVAGAVTNVKPSGGQHLVIIGYVEYAHAVNGRLYIKISNGWELTELHDTDIVSPTNNQALIYESATALWKNKSIATALGYTPANSATTLTINGVTYDLSANRSWTISAGISGSGASGQVAYWDGTTSQAGSNNLFWDAANGRLGIGLNNPTSRLHVSSTAWNSTDPFVSFVNLDPQGAESKGLYVQAGALSASSYIVNFANYSGTSFFYLDGIGNLGIKTTSPSYTLDVADVARFRTQIRFSDVWNISHADSANRFLFNTNSSTTFGSPSGYIWQTATTQIMALFSTGNLLLQNGGTFTDSGQRLQVQGTTLLNGNVTFSSSTGMFWDATNSRLGIGTNVPSGTLDIVKTGAAGNNTIILKSNSNVHANIIVFRNADNSGQGGFLATGSSYSYGTYLANQSNLNGGAGGIGLRVANTTGTHISFYGGNADSDFGTKFFQMTGSTGNFILQNGGTFTDGGQRLQVIGDTLLRGSGATSATTALTVQNSSSTVLGRFQNDGAVTLGAGGWLTIGEGQRYLYKSLNLTSIFTIGNDSTVGATIDLYGSSHATNANRIFLNGSQVRITSASVLMTALPTSSAGLPTGALWNDAGTVKIV